MSDEISGPGGVWQQPGMPPSGWAPPVTADGIVPLRPYGLGAIYTGMRRVTRAAPATVVAASLLGFAITAAITIGAGPTATYSRDRFHTRSYDGAETLQVHQHGSALVRLLALLGGVVVAALLVPLVLRLTAGQRSEPSDGSRGAGRRAALPALALAVLGVPVTLLTLLASSGHAGLYLVVLGLAVVLIWVRNGLSLMPAVAVAEDLGLLAAARRSWSLVRRSWWRTFGYEIMFGIVGVAVGFVIGVGSAQATTGVGLDSSMAFPGRGILTVISLGALFTLPMAAIGQTLLYVDLRSRKEGLAWSLQAARADPSRPVFGRGGTYASPSAR